MKAIVLRIGALGIMLLLGCFAMARAQRDDSDAAGAAVADSPARPALRPDGNDPHPLRGVQASSARPYPSAPVGSQPVARRPATNPFGLQARRSADVVAASAAEPPINDSIPDAPPREIGRAEPAPHSEVASTDLTGAGPALGPGNSAVAGNRRASGSIPAKDRDDSRYAATGSEREPAPFRADPSAAPAAPSHSIPSDGGGLGSLAGNGRAGEIADSAEGSGQPGAQQLEGVQSPQLTIQKTAPKEVQVGKPAKFTVTVRNVGQSPASEVEIRDLVPRGTRLIDTTPPATHGTRGEVVWSLGTLKPGEESTVAMQLLPLTEGEVGSVATVHFGADASARSVATRPQLTVQTTAPDKVLIGDKLVLSIVVSNPGSGVATGVVIDERIPPGLQHPAGAELEYEVGDLKPGESRKLELSLAAVQPGPTTNLLSVRGDGDLRAEHPLDIEVLAPQLDVAVDGPKRRYLERQAVYQLSVSNPGTASAKQVELAASLPQGLKFVSANNAGHYEEATRTVHWRLEELPANESGSVELVTMPVEAGQHAIRLRGTADKGLAVEREQPVVVEGVAAILFQVSDAADPIQVNEETAYEVRVINQGSKGASNVQLAVDLPPEVTPLAAEGQTRNRCEGNRVTFDAIASLAPKAETTFRIRVKATRPGDLRTRFHLKTDDMQTPVMKEESTRVYGDE